MNDTLKAAGRIGAELGAAKAENEKLHGLLREVIACQAAHYGDATDLHLAMITLADRLKGALSQQADPAETTEAYTAVDMATAAAQGFRDGQAAVEQAAAQDERKTFEAWVMQHNTAVREDYDDTDENAPEDIRLDRQGGVYIWANAEAAWFAWKARSALDTRPAQTEQQPSAAQQILDLIMEECRYWHGRDEARRGNFANLYAAAKELADNAAPIAQTEQQPAFLLEIGADGEYAVQVRDKDWLRSMRNKREHQTHNLYSAPIAQTEQQPVLSNCLDLVEKMTVSVDVSTGDDDAFNRLFCKVAGVQEESDGSWTILAVDPEPNFAALIAQTAPQGKFRMGDLVKKSTGSEWVGRVVGWYSTEQTKEGYAVESSAHRNSVQIYPATALEAVE
jgi:hypothetical protein